jgi:DNA-binding NarL/FixJ family response regulator
MKEITVLMLDNNQRFLATAKDFLSEQDFIKEVFTTMSDTDARRIASEKEPDVILLDILMPGQNGINLVPFLREQSPNSKIIMLTLWDLNGYRDSALENGADDFIAKKTMADTLIPTIRKVINM